MLGVKVKLIYSQVQCSHHRALLAFKLLEEALRTLSNQLFRFPCTVNSLQCQLLINSKLINLASLRLPLSLSLQSSSILIWTMKKGNVLLKLSKRTKKDLACSLTSLKRSRYLNKRGELTGRSSSSSGMLRERSNKN